MLIPVSDTAFIYNDQLVDVLQMKYASRNCGGAKIHERGRLLTMLMAVADEVRRGIAVDEAEVAGMLARL
jgi:hypothetical protein